jgi:hypothetical protein
MNLLNQGQQKIHDECIDWFKNSSEQIFQIAGAAGTGKTFLIYKILESLRLQPNQYMPMAYTGQASNVLRSRGFFTARSIHSSLYEVVEVPDDSINEAFGVPKKKRIFRKKLSLPESVKLLFIDEGYMVPDWMRNDILSFGKKIIITGDTNQLPPVGGKPCFLINGKIHRLTELMRQAQSDPIIYLADRAIKGQPIHCGVYGNNVLVVTDEEFTPQMIGYADVIGCGTNKTRDMMNRYIRQLVGFRTELPCFGERVICRNNNWEMEIDGIALCNGLTGTVMSQPDVSEYNGKAFYINFKPDLTNSMFYDVPVNYEYFTSTHEIRQDMKNISMKYFVGEMFEFAYCLTTHLMQGSEYNNLVYIQEYLHPQIQNQLDYTAITRAKKSLIFIVKKNKYFYIPGYKKGN